MLPFGSQHFARAKLAFKFFPGAPTPRGVFRVSGSVGTNTGGGVSSRVFGHVPRWVLLLAGRAIPVEYAVAGERQVTEAR